MSKNNNHSRTGICILIPVAIIAAAGVALHFGARIIPDTAEADFLYGEEVTIPDYQAHLFGADIHDQIQTESSINEKKPGEYPVTYTWKFLGIPFQKVQSVVRIIDADAPVITMKDDVVCFTKINEPYSLPEYSVEDNCDSPEDIDIQITGDVDNTREGTYKAMLKACDLSGNCSGHELTMVVGNISDREFADKDFRLENYDEDHTVWPLRQPDQAISDEQFSRILFCGDSNYVNMSVYHGLPGRQVIGRYALAPDTFEMPSFYRGQQTNTSVSSYIKALKPEYLVLNMGLAEIKNGDPYRLIDGYRQCISEIQELSPDTKIVIAAVLPVCEDYNEPGLQQSQVNRYNYCLLQMCRELKLPLIDPNIYFMNHDTGWADDRFFLEDGYHISAAYFNLYTEFVRESMVMED